MSCRGARGRGILARSRARGEARAGPACIATIVVAPAETAVTTPTDSAAISTRDSFSGPRPPRRPTMRRCPELQCWRSPRGSWWRRRPPSRPKAATPRREVVSALVLPLQGDFTSMQGGSLFAAEHGEVGQALAWRRLLPDFHDIPAKCAARGAHVPELRGVRTGGPRVNHALHAAGQTLQSQGRARRRL